MHIKKILSVPFVREASGMLGGALVALVVYGVYQQASGLVTAYVLPAEAPVVSDEVAQMRRENIQTIALRAREILEQSKNTQVQ